MKVVVKAVMVMTIEGVGLSIREFRLSSLFAYLD